MAMTTTDKVEAVAEALYTHRYGTANGSWDEFRRRKPDIAEIYRDNARVAIKAVAEAA
jgi:hypothetical protein